MTIERLPAASTADVLPEKKEKITKTLKYEFTNNELLQIGQEPVPEQEQGSDSENDDPKTIEEVEKEEDDNPTAD